MAERLKPTANQVLFVAEDDLELIEPWPLELRALFDPQADRDLARRVAQERTKELQDKADEELPF